MIDHGATARLDVVGAFLSLLVGTSRSPRVSPVSDVHTEPKELAACGALNLVQNNLCCRPRRRLVSSSSAQSPRHNLPSLASTTSRAQTARNPQVSWMSDALKARHGLGTCSACQSCAICSI